MSSYCWAMPTLGKITPSFLRAPIMSNRNTCNSLASCFYLVLSLTWTRFCTAQETQEKSLITHNTSYLQSQISSTLHQRYSQTAFHFLYEPCPYPIRDSRAVIMTLDQQKIPYRAQSVWVREKSQVDNDCYLAVLHSETDSNWDKIHHRQAQFYSLVCKHCLKKSIQILCPSCFSWSHYSSFNQCQYWKHTDYYPQTHSNCGFQK